MYNNIPILSKLNNYGESGLKTPIRGSDIAEKLVGKKGYFANQINKTDSNDKYEVLNSRNNLISYLPQTESNSIIDPNNRRATTTHKELHDFVLDFDLRKFGIGFGHRVAIIMPNGPDLAVCLICIISGWCAAPINSTGAVNEIRSELESTGAKAVIILKGRANNEAIIDAASKISIGVLELSPNDEKCGLFSIELLKPAQDSIKEANISVAESVEGFDSYSNPQTVLLLHTSGTSGNKKCVPYSLDMIIVGVACIISSWNLSSPDICLNMMPLFHIGGIMRNILSPLLSGGSVITCSAFDANLFWELLKVHNFTWYYAAPTMHHAILKASEGVERPLPVRTVRFIANAAGGLLPILAQSLKDTFNAVILTSYGMTECMPISSPTQSYSLDPNGTSGKAVGPDIIITNEDRTEVQPTGTAGNILVRGPPCFGGYESNKASNDESFFTINGIKGWFDTGDMGSIDENGYLFISGRSKEIINKGGETISPFEIEEQIQQHPSVSETLAFSTPHELYQEAVGCIIVTKPNQPRVDLFGLYDYLENRLTRSKWPQVIIYMDGLPKNQAGKILRIKLAERTNIPSIDDKTSPIKCLFEAEAPKIGTPLSGKIPITPIEISVDEVRKFISTRIEDIDQCEVVKLNSKYEDVLVAFVVTSFLSSEDILSECKSHLHGYLVPAEVIIIESFPYKSLPDSDSDSDGKVVDFDELERQAIHALNSKVILPRSEIELEVEEVWRSELIGNEGNILNIKDNFFNLGGDSLKAGQVVNAMKKKFKVSMSVSDLLSAPTIEHMSSLVHNLKNSLTNAIGSTPTLISRLSASFLNNFNPLEHKYTSLEEGKDSNFIHKSNEHSNSSWGILLFQTIPILVLYPLRKISVWFFIAYPWITLMNMGIDRFYALVMAILISRVILSTVSPIVGICLKWLIIGRYTPGKYPLWGSMYIRWWLAEQVLSITGRGIFNNDVPIIGQYLVTSYYRLLGAKIGNNVKINTNSKLGQYDLLEIGDNVNIDASLIRPFSLEAGHFVLLPIKIGKNCTICLKSSIAAGSEIPDNTCIGPASSSHELDDAHPKYRKYCRQVFQSPPFYLQAFAGVPLILTVLLAAYIPWIYGLNLMITSAEKDGWYLNDLTNVFEAFRWWVTPERIIWYFALRVIKECLVPVLKLTIIILIKRLVLGKFKPCGDLERNYPWNLFRYWILSKLLPGGKLCGVINLVGSHYEIVSIIYRLLGATIGKRVYWPGSGVDIVEFDLLEIGDDVVFGSRSAILTSSAERSAKVCLEDGVMLADRSVLLPGVRLKKGSVIGSGGLAPEDFTADYGSVWVGSSKGSVKNVTPADDSYKTKDSIAPFGEAFYEGKADYFVLTLPWVVFYNLFWQILCAMYSNCSVVLSVYLVYYIKNYPAGYEEKSWLLFVYIFLVFSPLNLVVELFATFIDISSKWLILGRREKGTFSWNRSSYCQRWQIYLTIQKIRGNFIDLIHGSEYLCVYFRLLGANIGREVCLYPNGGDPMMTEPELVTIGDYVSIDDASVIAHINTRGIFKLNPLVIGDYCVLKSNSRLISGASMDNNSILLEHTLILLGETVDSNSVYQGWPSEGGASLTEYNSLIDQKLRDLAFSKQAFKENNMSSFHEEEISYIFENLSEDRSLIGNSHENSYYDSL